MFRIALTSLILAAALMTAHPAAASDRIIKELPELPDGALRTCFEASYFITLGEACITYSRKTDETLAVTSIMKSSPLLTVFKALDDKGFADITVSPLTTAYFFFHQKEGKVNRQHSYTYDDDGVNYQIVNYHYKSNQVKKSKSGRKEGVGLLDPYGLALAMQRGALFESNGVANLFYDEKIVPVDYKTVGRKRVETPAGKFSTTMVDSTPEIDPEGLLKPKGTWRFFIDRKTGILVRMEVGFSIGKANLQVISVEGDRTVLASAFN